MALVSRRPGQRRPIGWQPLLRPPAVPLGPDVPALSSFGSRARILSGFHRVASSAISTRRSWRRSRVNDLCCCPYGLPPLRKRMVLLGSPWVSPPLQAFSVPSSPFRLLARGSTLGSHGLPRCSVHRSWCPSLLRRHGGGGFRPVPGTPFAGGPRSSRRWFCCCWDAGGGVVLLISVVIH